MDQPVAPVQVTLLTIVTPFALQDRLIGDLKAAGAIEYSLLQVDPCGPLGHRPGASLRRGRRGSRRWSRSSRRRRT